MSDTPDVQLLERIWTARQTGDLGPLREALAPDAQWFNVSEGEWDCHDRDTILRVMQGNKDRGISGSMEDVEQFGTRIVVGVRPSGRPPSRRLDVARSIGFYRHLGFVVTSEFAPGDEVIWLTPATCRHCASNSSRQA